MSINDFINSLTNEQCLIFGFICGMLFDIIGSIICACSVRKKYIGTEGKVLQNGKNQ